MQYVQYMQINNLHAELAVEQGINVVGVSGKQFGMDFLKC
jgi:hypothetical protein